MMKGVYLFHVWYKSEEALGHGLWVVAGGPIPDLVPGFHEAHIGSLIELCCFLKEQDNSAGQLRGPLKLILELLFG